MYQPRKSSCTSMDSHRIQSTRLKFLPNIRTAGAPSTHLSWRPAWMVSLTPWLASRCLLLPACGTILHARLRHCLHCCLLLMVLFSRWHFITFSFLVFYWLHDLFAWAAVNFCGDISLGCCIFSALEGWVLTREMVHYIFSYIHSVLLISDRNLHMIVACVLCGFVYFLSLSGVFVVICSLGFWVIGRTLPFCVSHLYCIISPLFCMECFVFDTKIYCTV